MRNRQNHGRAKLHGTVTAVTATLEVYLGATAQGGSNEATGASTAVEASVPLPISAEQRLLAVGRAYEVSRCTGKGLVITEHSSLCNGAGGS